MLYLKWFSYVLHPTEKSQAPNICKNGYRKNPVSIL